MGYEFSSCDPRGPAPKRLRLTVEGPCGGMKKVHGVRQVFGGTLPAKVFAEAQKNLRRIKAERAARAAGLPVPSASPSRSPRPHRATATVSPTPRRTPSPTPAPETRSPTPEPTATSILPGPPAPTTTPPAPP
jgi:hypothetical protein